MDSTIRTGTKLKQKKELNEHGWIELDWIQNISQSVLLWLHALKTFFMFKLYLLKCENILNLKRKWANWMAKGFLCSKQEKVMCDDFNSFREESAKRKLDESIVKSWLENEHQIKRMEIE